MYMYGMSGVSAHSGRTARTMHPQGPGDPDSPVSADNAGAETEAHEGHVDGLGVVLQRPHYSPHSGWPTTQQRKRTSCSMTTTRSIPRKSSIVSIPSWSWSSQA